MPADIASVASYAKTFIDAVKFAREVRSSLIPAAAPTSDDTQFELILSLWGSILFETRENCQRARHILERAKENRFTFGTFTFQVTDAVLPEFCRLAPAPRILVQTARLVSRLRRIDEFQRIGNNAPGFTSVRGEGHLVALGFAQEFHDQGGIKDFNEALGIANTVARAVFQKGPEQPTSYLLPEPIDESTPVDLSTI